MTRRSSSSDYQYTTLVFDDACTCLLCTAWRQRQLELDEAYRAEAGVRTEQEAKLAAWHAIRVAKAGVEKAARVAGTWHRDKS